VPRRHTLQRRACIATLRADFPQFATAPTSSVEPNIYMHLSSALSKCDVHLGIVLGQGSMQYLSDIPAPTVIAITFLPFLQGASIA